MLLLLGTELSILSVLVSFPEVLSPIAALLQHMVIKVNVFAIWRSVLRFLVRFINPNGERHRLGLFLFSESGEGLIVKKSRCPMRWTAFFFNQISFQTVFLSGWLKRESLTHPPRSKTEVCQPTA
jgi:hypothetical protein